MHLTLRGHVNQIKIHTFYLINLFFQTKIYSLLKRLSVTNATLCDSNKFIVFYSMFLSVQCL